MTRLLALAIALPALVTAPAGAVADSAQPAISVTVSNGVDQAAPGDTSTYRVIVENSGGADFAGSVDLRLPEFADIAADTGVEGGTATWSVELPAGQSADFEAEVTFARDAGDAYQVVGLAEVRDASGDLVVRAADADGIPGAHAPAAVPGMTPDGADGFAWSVPVLIGAGSVLALAGVSWWLIASRRRPRDG